MGYNVDGRMNLLSKKMYEAAKSLHLNHYNEFQNTYYSKEEERMRLIGNILWFIFGGLESGLAWIIAGCLWCITIIGIPIGLQCFKFAGLAFWPFGKEVVYGGGAMSLIANIFWIIISGIPMAIGNTIVGCLWCITIIGIPFGKQFFKIARLSLMPFGAS